MKKLLFSATFTLLGIAIISIPNFVSYIDTGSFYFDLAKFLKDYPGFTYPFGALFIVFGSVYFASIIIELRREKTVFVIQKADEEDYGDIDLRFPKHVIGSKDELVYENNISLNNYDSGIIGLEKKKIMHFYKRIEPKKKIAFLAISPMPTLVYAGYVVANSGREVVFYHWDRDKTKAVRLKRFGSMENLKENRVVNSSSNEYVLCISTSYLINENLVLKQFNGCNIKFYKLENPNYNAVKTQSNVRCIANYVRERIAKLPHGSHVHLLLSCSSELCFAIGQTLNSQVLPNIRVYNLGKNEKNENFWNWSIDLN